MGMGDVMFAHGTVQLLFNGIFTYSSPGHPSNFSAFCFTKRPPCQQNQEERAIQLHLITAQNLFRPAADVVNSSKQSITVPSGYIQLGSQLSFFTGASKVFFGQASPLTDGLRQVTVAVERNRVVFKNAAALDNLFCAQFLYAIDFRTQLWIENCQDAETD